VWDLPVRITHWLLVISVFGSYITSKFGANRFSWHKYCGYTILVLVTFRIAWGFVGTRYARFAQFMRSPSQAYQYLWTLGRKASTIAMQFDEIHGSRIGLALLIVATLAAALAGALLLAPEASLSIF
jgi:cytochrome b